MIIFFLTKRKESVENERWKTEKGTEVTETEHRERGPGPGGPQGFEQEKEQMHRALWG